MPAPQTEVLITVDGVEQARHVLTPGDYVIGREASCHLRVDAERTSREHAKLILNYDEALIEDLGSSSGTFVNDAPVKERTRLWPGQKIRVGAATVTFRRLQGEQPTDMSLAPAQRAIRTMLPADMLQEKRYDIGSVVARGGMGEILDAREAAIERRVAMKVMLDMNDADAVTRFITEAKITGQLEHPNVVPVHELGVHENGQPFYTMKMVKGVTLKKVIEQLAARDAEALAKYPLPALLTIFQKVCDALAFAHSKGVIHRDLKPENVMVGEFGEALVMDWGLAKVLDAARVTETTGPSQETRSMVRKPAADAGTGSQTISGTVMGTPQYMSPEQAEGRIEELDARSDIFSLGGILYTILTLRPPVEGKTVEEMLKKVASASITPPSVFGTSAQGGEPGVKGEILEAKKIKPLPHIPGGRVPAALSAVVMKALSLRREDRYQTVAEFSADIAKYQTGFATKAEHASFMKQILLLIRRNKGIFLTGFVAWLIITALAVWFIIHLRASEHETRRQAEIAQQNERKAVIGEQRAKAEAERATKAEAEAVQEKEAARQSSAKANLALAEAARRDGNGAAMQAALNDVPDDLRDSTWSYLLAQADTSIARIRLGNSDTVSAVPHPQQPGVFAVANAASTEVALIEVRTGAKLLSFKPVFPPNASGGIRLAVSPDGERIAVGRNGPGGIAIHSARDGSKLLAWDSPAADRMEFSPDGKLLLQVNAAQVHIWDAADGKAACVFPTEPTGSNVRAIFSPDSQSALIFDYNEKKGIPLIRARGGELVRMLPRLRFTVRAMLMRKDGRVVAVGDGGAVAAVDLQDGHVVSEFQTGAARTDHLALTPDGETVVAARQLPDGRQSLQLWDAATGRPLQALLGGSGAINAVSVHPLSGELVVSGPNARAWSLTGTPARWTLHGTIEGTAFFGADDLIFAGASGSAFALHKLEAGTPVVQWKPASGTYRLPVVSADGRVAAVGRTSSNDPILMLRNPGPSVEQFATVPIKFTLDAMSLSPTGDRLAVIVGGRGATGIYDPVTGKQAVKLEQTDIKKRWRLGWLDGQRLLGLVTARADRGNPGSEEWIVLWDTTTGKVLQTATNRTAMDVLAIAPDGKRFAEAGADKIVRIRDAATLAVQQEFRAHDGPITALIWHPVKPILATASEDLSIRLWNLETGERLEEFRGPSLPPVGLAFSPGGNRLACAVKDDGTRIWEPDSLNPKSKQDAEHAADGWENLLARLTPVIVANTGNGWRMDGGALFSPGKQFASLALPGNLGGASYQLRVKLRQLTAKGVFHLDLPVADRMVGFDLDGFPQDGFYTGLIRVNGKAGKDVPGAAHGKQVKDSEQHDLEVTVRPDGANATITTTLDGQPLQEWTGPTADLSQDVRWITPPGTLALGTTTPDWVVYEVKVKRGDAAK